MAWIAHRKAFLTDKVLLIIAFIPFLIYMAEVLPHGRERLEEKVERCVLQAFFWNILQTMSYIEGDPLIYFQFPTTIKYLLAENISPKESSLCAWDARCQLQYDLQKDTLSLGYLGSRMMGLAIPALFEIGLSLCRSRCKEIMSHVQSSVLWAELKGKGEPVSLHQQKNYHEQYVESKAAANRT